MRKENIHVRRFKCYSKKDQKCSVNKQFVKLENAIYNLHLSVVNLE